MPYMYGCVTCTSIFCTKIPVLYCKAARYHISLSIGNTITVDGELENGTKVKITEGWYSKHIVEGGQLTMP